MAKRQRSNRIGPYVALPKAIKNTPAWRAMSPGARLLWIELRGWLRNDWSNNGRMFCSCRIAAKEIGCNKDTVAHYYVENEHFGFLRKTRGGCLGVDGYGIAPHYRFTDLPHGTHAATRDFEKWGGAPFVYQPRRAARKKQNPVRKTRTPCPENPDIGSRRSGASLCLKNPDIHVAPRCPENPDITRVETH
jgi:hypothetical protein